MSKELTSSLERTKEMLMQAFDDASNDIGLNDHQEAAKEIIKIEREFFYGDVNNYQRLQTLRVYLEKKFKDVLEEEEK